MTLGRGPGKERGNTGGEPIGIRTGKEGKDGKLSGSGQLCKGPRKEFQPRAQGYQERRFGERRATERGQTEHSPARDDQCPINFGSISRSISSVNDKSPINFQRKCSIFRSVLPA